MSETIRTKEELLALFADNTVGAITPAFMRDFVVSNQVNIVQNVTVSDETVLAESDLVLLGNGAVDPVLPEASTYGKRTLGVGNVSNAVVTLHANIGGNINGQPSIDLDPFSYAILVGPEVGVGWLMLLNSSGFGGAVDSVAGKTGDVTLVKADITDFSDGDYATASHTHLEADITDLDKYTQLEVDNAIAAVPVFSGDYGDLTNVPTEFNPSVHTHVKAEITDFNEGDYATSSHTHVEADITDLDKYTQNEVDTALSGKANTSHTHTVSDITDYVPNVYGTERHQVADLTYTSTTNGFSSPNASNTKLSITTSALPAGSYVIKAYFQFMMTKDKRFEAALYHTTAATYLNDAMKYKSDENSDELSQSFTSDDLVLSGVHTFELVFGPESGGETATIGDAVMELIRVG